MKPTKNGSPTVSEKTSDLQRKIINRTAHVGIIGMGYVGLPTMMAAAEVGFRVTGIDLSEERVGEFNSGHSYIEDVTDDAISSMIAAGKINATTDHTILREIDVVLVCVPTPITKNKEPDLSALEHAVTALAENQRVDQLIVLQSTTFPGTTEEFVLPRLEQEGHQVGTDFNLAFASERIDPGNTEYEFRNVPKVVGGVTPRCMEVAEEFFTALVGQVVSVSSPRIAEMTKLLENTFRGVNIALVNELAMLSHRMGIDIWEVIDAASTKPFGFMPFYPGPGVGGHCIPVDPFYLSWKAKEYDFYVNFIQLAAETNDYMPYYTLSRIGEILSDHGKPLKGARLLVLGVTFKEDVNDTRNSPAIRVMELLLAKGAQVDYSDHNVPSLCVSENLMISLLVDDELTRQFDAVLIFLKRTGHDINQIVDSSSLVIDARNATGDLGPRANVVKI
ncbi:nucleotide sugar dehydrogenase [SAR202 cluster bacterium AD-802-F09_MRT_200m]|nr:nucleotide sugar dehydrogenase [SAR202 cluster bacterium AD-802-F09_MRT_200m]